MHRSIRWLVGTLASILGLGLLLVRWGLWASDSRLVVENTHAVRSILTAAQNEPAFLIYGAVVFLLLVGFALLIPTSKRVLFRTPPDERLQAPRFLALIAPRFRVMPRGERNSGRSPSCPSSVARFLLNLVPTLRRIHRSPATQSAPGTRCHRARCSPDGRFLSDPG